MNRHCVSPEMSDPRMDPQPGDVLRRGRQVRIVCGREDACGQPGVLYTTPAKRRKGVWIWLALDLWQRWAAGAERIEG